MNNKKTYKAVVKYMITKDLYQYKELDQLERKDIYTNNYDYSADYMKEYIKNDMLAVITNNWQYKYQIMILNINLTAVKEGTIC